MAFDGFRRSFDELLRNATRPEDRRIVASRMRETLVQAKMSLRDLREGIEKTQQRLTEEERELVTVQRRKQLAEGIKDRETVEIATKYEHMHAERVAILRQKVSAQEAELALAERDVNEMSAELKAVLAGTDARAGSLDSAQADGVSDESSDGSSTTPGLNDEIDSLGRARNRAAREEDAARRLDELKRRMGK